jgi:hypothetical protein
LNYTNNILLGSKILLKVLTQTSFAKSKVFFWVVKKAKSIQNVFLIVLPISMLPMEALANAFSY